VSLGIILNNYGPNDIAYQVIKAINIYRGFKDVALFYENIMRPCITPTTSLVHIYGLSNYSHPVITFDIETTKTALDTIGPTAYYLYVWNLEWLHKTANYEYYDKVYNDKRINLIVRSKEQEEVLFNNFGVKIAHIMPKFNLNKILEITNAT
jgi:hypothetical protein